MKNNKIEVNDYERTLIVKGLERLIGEIDRLLEGTIKVNMPKAIKEIEYFKAMVQELSERIMGVKKLPFEIPCKKKKTDARNADK